MDKKEKDTKIKHKCCGYEGPTKIVEGCNNPVIATVAVGPDVPSLHFCKKHYSLWEKYAKL